MPLLGSGENLTNTIPKIWTKAHHPEKSTELVPLLRYGETPLW
jgi:hypothetical protein